MSNDLKHQYITLIQEHEGIIHKVIGLHIDDVEDKKDLFQEILLQAWKSFSRFEGKSSFSTWLYRVALNTVFTFKRHAKKKEKIGLDQVKEPAQTPQSQEPHEHLYYLVKQLDEVDRTLFTLHLEGYKNKEIAKLMGMTTNHVNVKVHRLKNKIVESLKNNQWTFTKSGQK